MANSKMSVEVRYFKKIKVFLCIDCIDKVQELLKSINKTKHKSRLDMMK